MLHVLTSAAKHIHVNSRAVYVFVYYLNSDYVWHWHNNRYVYIEHVQISSAEYLNVQYAIWKSEFDYSVISRDWMKFVWSNIFPNHFFLI